MTSHPSLPWHRELKWHHRPLPIVAMVKEGHFPFHAEQKKRDFPRIILRHRVSNFVCLFFVTSFSCCRLRVVNSFDISFELRSSAFCVFFAHQFQCDILISRSAFFLAVRSALLVQNFINNFPMEFIHNLSCRKQFSYSFSVAYRLFNTMNCRMEMITFLGKVK